MLQVEVNLLTGQTTILQVDIIYDCGQSLNPAVDLGQVGPNLIFFFSWLQFKKLVMLPLLT